MSIKNTRKQYNALKSFNGKQYTGMRVGGRHSWDYKNGRWNETKIAPEKWRIDFSSKKFRTHHAPTGSGALNNTQYHWYIIADQRVNKLDANTYNTRMTGLKYKIAHRRPNWNHWSYEYHDETYEDIIIRILEETLENLRAKRRQRELTQYLK